MRYGVTPSQLMRQPLDDFHLDMAIGVAGIMRQQKRLKDQTRKADDTWTAIRDAVVSALEGTR